MRIPGWMFVVGLLVFAAMTAVCAVVTYTVAHDLAIDFAGDDIPTAVAFNAQPTAIPTAAPPTHTPPPGVTFTPAPTATAGPTSTPDPLGDVPIWDDPGRTTILIMGIDQRAALEVEPAYHTDTMILVQIDPARQHIGVLSIPRDLWVNIPNFNQDRINQANYLGDLNAVPPLEGPGLAMETVRVNLGVRVDHYVRVNFTVFTEVVDTVAPDGVEICVEETIIDDDYPDAGYGTIAVRFDPGCQVMPGERLLQYARTRATEGSDFDRARRQQEVMDALRNEVLNAGGVVNFITQIPALYNTLEGNFVTSLSAEDIISLGRLVSGFPRDNITFEQIDARHVTFATGTDGRQVLLPRQAGLSRAVQAAFNPLDTGDLTLAELRQRAETENADIVVFNNTEISGLAGNTRTWLQLQNVAVVAVGNVPGADGSDTTIRDYTGNPWTTRYLAALLGIPQARIVTANDGATDADVMIAVGPDIQPLLSGE